MQLAENNKKMEALGIRTLAASLRNSTANECSHNQDKQTNKNVRGEGSDSFEYLLELKRARKTKMKVFIIA